MYNRSWGLLLLLGGLFSILSFSCDSVHGSAEGNGEYIPEAPNYKESTYWYAKKGDATGKGADVFYVVSTWEIEWRTEEGQLCRYADVHNPAHRANMKKEISRIAEYMGEGNDFYSPYYRHMAIETWATLNEDTIQHRFRLAMGDVREAFDIFLKQRRPDRPLVLAGFSQGGKAVVELLKSMSDEVYQQLAAAYVLGYKVTPADTVGTSHIRAAKDSIDTGVTICYNSVSDIRHIKPVIAAPSVMCINPVNWRTDATPALLHDSISVAVSPEHHVLVLEGYSGSEYLPIMGFLNVGDFHSCEPWLYQDCLRENIQARIRAFHQINSSK